MYSPQDVADFKKLTEKLLQKSTEEHLSQEEAGQIVNDLRDVINFHDHQYYVQAQPIVTDYEYDRLFKLLKEIELQYPALCSDDSPTQRVARGLTKDFPSVAHLVPMLSLDNSYDENDLRDFDRRARELSGRAKISYSVEPKFDGASVSLVYENDRLLRGATRGDGIMGEDITPNIKVIKSIPIKARFSDFGIHTIEIRGEMMIRKKRFEELNRQRSEAGQPLLANPRNTAAGSLRMVDSAEVAKRGLEGILYHISYAVDKAGNDLLGETLKSRRENIAMLHQLGFRCPHHEMRKCDEIEDVISYIEEWEKKRDELDYEIDGMVVKVDELALEDQLGATTHHPRWAIAYKFRARQARSKLLRVDFQVGRTGNITPVAKLNPVQIGGVTVTSASMFNEDFIKEKDIRIGDDVLVERAGDVIPYIAGIITDARSGEEEPIKFPRHCPSCHSELVRAPEEAAWRCVNSSCPAQVYERLLHFVSKDAMDISGLGKATIETFMEKDWIKTIPDIYRLPEKFEEIKQLEGFGEKSVDKLRESLEVSKSRLPHRLLFGLGIRYVGETTARNLMEAVQCIEELEGWDQEKLSQIRDVGPKVAGSIHDYFQAEANLKMLFELKEAGLQTCRGAKERTEGEGGPLGGLNFLFTGSLNHFGRHEAKEMVEKAGGTVASALSSKVDYLVVGADPGSKVDKAKKLSTVKIISEEEFLGMINRG